MEKWAGESGGEEDEPKDAAQGVDVQADVLGWGDHAGWLEGQMLRVY